MKETLKLGLVLAAFAAGACVALALVYAVTGPTIEGLEAKQLELSLKDLFPAADAFRELDGDIKPQDDSVSFDPDLRGHPGGRAAGHRDQGARLQLRRGHHPAGGRGHGPAHHRGQASWTSRTPPAWAPTPRAPPTSWTRPPRPPSPASSPENLYPIPSRSRRTWPPSPPAPSPARP
ncbi:MAG: hypothetical protein MZV70_35080 [Desulfobacterales bacterium]|nr:hypothetical protein [Desulfobacterales bacterium]